MSECQACGQTIVRGTVPNRPELWTAAGDPFCGHGAHRPASSTTFPFHYRDSGAPCEWSGTEGWTEGKTCPNGCDGSRTHYANDGHPECKDEPWPDSTTPSRP